MAGWQTQVHLSPPLQGEIRVKRFLSDAFSKQQVCLAVPAAAQGWPASPYELWACWKNTWFL